ncbi:hypothetical protein HRJ34_26015 [Rhizorhabdus wittichii]|uniref:Uncharacterized protein n=1 Tax=Rhizorhabdus wittichii TaxID=160791 RepID=A0A975D4U8_9SPHN|nr:hypothetical protein [Rhizorhabdus wittichii]QTH21715.1 hypothetical protein HRJ34_26015 [Rhizorhabdus wittichii]
MTLDLKAALEQAIRNRFAAGQIETVSITDGVAADGERVFNVTIVFNKTLDVAKAASLARYMRSTLEEADEPAFPIIAFRSVADQKKLQAAAA